jgi:metal transporter CNNM
MVLAFQ